MKPEFAKAASKQGHIANNSRYDDMDDDDIDGSAGFVVGHTIAREEAIVT